MSDNEVNEGTVRVSLRIPAWMVERIDEIRGPYRERTSMILEMIGTYLEDYDVREKERVQQDHRDPLPRPQCRHRSISRVRSRTISRLQAHRSRGGSHQGYRESCKGSREYPIVSESRAAGSYR